MHATRPNRYISPAPPIAFRGTPNSMYARKPESRAGARRRGPARVAVGGEKTVAMNAGLHFLVEEGACVDTDDLSLELLP
jgi:hypothetical protein